VALGGERESFRTPKRGKDTREGPEVRKVLKYSNRPMGGGEFATQKGKRRKNSGGDVLIKKTLKGKENLGRLKKKKVGDQGIEKVWGKKSREGRRRRFEEKDRLANEGSKLEMREGKPWGGDVKVAFPPKTDARGGARVKKRKEKGRGRKNLEEKKDEPSPKMTRIMRGKKYNKKREKPLKGLKGEKSTIHCRQWRSASFLGRGGAKTLNEKGKTDGKSPEKKRGFERVEGKLPKFQQPWGRC